MRFFFYSFECLLYYAGNSSYDNFPAFRTENTNESIENDVFNDVNLCTSHVLLMKNQFEEHEESQ